MSKSAMMRTHVVLPRAMVKAIDARVGKRERSQFLAEVVDRELKRQALMDLLKRPGALIDSAKHPEWENGSAEWVRTMRQQDLRIETGRRKRVGAHGRISA